MLFFFIYGHYPRDKNKNNLRHVLFIRRRTPAVAPRKPLLVTLLIFFGLIKAIAKHRSLLYTFCSASPLIIPLIELQPLILYRHANVYRKLLCLPCLAVQK